LILTCSPTPSFQKPDDDPAFERSPLSRSRRSSRGEACGARCPCVPAPGFVTGATKRDGTRRMARRATPHRIGNFPRPSPKPPGSAGSTRLRPVHRDA